MESWLSYWNAPNKSYVNDRHRTAHFDVVFAGVRPYLPSGPSRCVLDWGCGDAFAAECVADLSGTVLLYEAAATTRDRLRKRYGACPRIRVLDDEDLDGLPENSIDLVIVNSVIQYLSVREFDDALRRFHGLLKSDGALLLGDIINPETATIRHLATFLGFAWRNNFLISAIFAVARTSVSPYRRLQRVVGLAAYTPEQILAKLQQHDFIGERLRENIAVSRYRSSFIARKSE